MAAITKSVGLIKWFDHEKKFGKIGSPGIGDVFLHLNQWTDKEDTKLLKATAVIFELTQTAKGSSAINACTPATYEDFEIIMSHLVADPSVPIEIPVSGKSRFGNSFKKNEVRQYNLVNYATHQLIRKLNATEVGKFFRSYFEEQLKFQTGPSIQAYYKLTKERISGIKAVFEAVALKSNNLLIDDTPTADALIYSLFSHYLQLTNRTLLFDIWKNKILSLAPVGWDLRYHAVEKSECFDFPIEIFEENYEKLFSDDLIAICQQPNGSSKVFQLIKTELNRIDFSNQNEIKRVFEKIAGLKVEDLKENLLDTFFDQALLTLKGPFETSDLHALLQITKESKYKENYRRFTDQLNLILSDEEKFKLWQETRYFEPEVTFLEKFLPIFNYSDFMASPVALQNIYFNRQFVQFLDLTGMEYFGSVMMLLIECPFDAAGEIFHLLSPAGRMACWLYFSRPGGYGSKRYYQFDYKQTHFPILQQELMDFGCEINDVEEVITAAGLVSKLQQKYFYVSDKEGFFDFGAIARLELIQKMLTEIAEQPQYNSKTVFKELFEKVKPELKLAVLQNFVPAVIDNETWDPGDIVDYIQGEEIDDSLKLVASAWLCQSMSIQKRAERYLSGHLRDISLAELFESFHLIKESAQPMLLRKIFYLYKKTETMERGTFLTMLSGLSQRDHINLNVRLAISLISTLERTDDIISENHFSEIVCRYVDEQVIPLLRIDDLFQICTGRTWMTPVDEPAKDRWYLRILDRNFPVNDDRVTISGRSYEFDKERRMVQFDGASYAFKWIKKPADHLIKRYEVPKGVTFCDASKSQVDETVGLTFHWCCNSKCFAPCQNDHSLIEWSEYSVRDFLTILKITYDPAKYYNFLSMVNRANRLFAKLGCKSCGRLLRDKKTSEFAFYRVTTFHCTNPGCSVYHVPVYLSHCLNWRCNNVVDDRISKRCPNGWVICDSCDECCSNKGIGQRLANLETNNAFNPNNPIHQRLVYQVKNHMGHLESGPVFDYITGQPKIN